MTNVIREKWTQTGQLKSKVIQPTEEINVPPGLLLDKQFIDSLRDLKALMVSEKNTLHKYKAHVVDNYKGVESKFSGLIKNLLSLGANISIQNQFRLFFMQLCDDIGDTIASLKLKPDEITILFKTLISSFNTIYGGANMRHFERYAATWQRFIEVICACILHLSTNTNILTAT